MLEDLDMRDRTTRPFIAAWSFTAAASFDFDSFFDFRILEAVLWRWADWSFVAEAFSVWSLATLVAAEGVAVVRTEVTTWADERRTREACSWGERRPEDLESGDCLEVELVGVLAFSGNDVSDVVSIEALEDTV